MPAVFPPAVADPWSLPGFWDSIVINGTTWGSRTQVGGKIVIRGASRFYKIDQKDAKGQDGSTQTYVGTHPKPFKLIFTIWTANQWAVFNETILPVFFYSGTRNKVQPITITHPATALCGINSVLTDDIEAPELNETSKEMTVTITVREYLPAAPGNASVTPKGAPPPATNSTPGYVPSPLVAQLQAQAQALQQVANGPSNFPSNQ